jgi:hypothetical protein
VSPARPLLAAALVMGLSGAANAQTVAVVGHTHGITLPCIEKTKPPFCVISRVTADPSPLVCDMIGCGAPCQELSMPGQCDNPPPVIQGQPLNHFPDMTVWQTPKPCRQIQTLDDGETLWLCQPGAHP